jgi:hypothetical protein
MRKSKNQCNKLLTLVCHLPVSGYLLGLFFYSGDGIITFARNFANFYRVTLWYIPVDITLRRHRCDNLKYAPEHIDAHTQNFYSCLINDAINRPRLRKRG